MNRRKSKRRPLRERILILCEGETERNYFQAIKEDPEYKSALSAVNPQIVTAKNRSPEQVVEEAIRRRDEEQREDNPFKEVWVVFDHDNHQYRRRAYEEAKKEGIHIAFSAIAFEGWFLLHYIRSSRAYSSGSALIDALHKYHPMYEKAKQNDFEYLKEKLVAALENAEWLRDQIFAEEKHITDYNPWIDVDVLVKKLIHLNE